MRALALVLLLTSCGATPTAEARDPEPHLAGTVNEVRARFDAERAMAAVAFMDRFFRVRGNAGYEQSLDRIERMLLAGGFPRGSVRRMRLGPDAPTWAPRAARLLLLEDDEALIRFEDQNEPDRGRLLAYSNSFPSTDLELVRAESVRAGADARGRAVLVQGNARLAFAELVVRNGATGILVYNPTPYQGSLPDASRFGYIPLHRGAAFGFSLSRRQWERLRQATEVGPARIRVEVHADEGRSAPGAIEARIDGRDPDAGTIVFVAHIDEPGANDNASGSAALAELARVLRVLAPQPRRTILFLWGQEHEVSRTWLAQPHPSVAAALVMDMVGADPAIVGAPFLLERTPDPGARWPSPPDRPSGWRESEASNVPAMPGHFLNDLTAAAASSISGWRWRTHPFEGGSDHVSFVSRGVPAILGWHFPDPAYHTSADRIERVSGDEMQRAAAVLGAVALVMANERPEEMLELVAIVERAAQRRLDALGAPSEARRAWTVWYDEALRSIARWAPTPELLARVARARRTLSAVQ